MSFVLTKKSGMTGIEHSMTLSITEAEFNEGQEKRRRGALIQSAFPTLDANQREFIMTGIVQSEWDTLKDEGECEQCGDPHPEGVLEGGLCPACCDEKT